MSKSKKELSFAEEVEQSLRKKFRKNIWCSLLPEQRILMQNGMAISVP